MMIRKRDSNVGFLQIAVSVMPPGVIGRKYEAPFLVDTGAIDSMAPSSELRRIGIDPVGRKRYGLADGSHQEFEFGLARLEFMGEITAGRILFGPDDIAPFLGVTALEAAGVMIDPATQTLGKLPAVRL